MDEASRVYAPLTRPGAIRLLKLLPPNAAGDNVECTLSPAFLDENPVYDALSYVWGDKMAADAILVNKQPFHTTELLREALLLLRDGLEEPLTLWVDAICINQRDPEERRDQVLQMRRIYACAQQTRIQLDDDEEQGEVFSLVVPLLDGLAECHSLLVAWQSQGQQNAIEKMLSVLWTILPGNEVWQVVPYLFLSRWFRRVWTIQELAVASKAVARYGRKQIDWSRLEDAIKMVQLARDFLESHPLGWVSQKEGGPLFHISNTDAVLDETQIKHLYMIYAVLPTTLIALRRQTRDNTPTSLLSVLRKAWYHEATDPRDKVYALLGLVAEDERSRYPVDYSMSTEKAYSLTTKIMLKHDSTMEVLCLAGIDQRSTVDLPSWCPDWRALEQTVDNKEALDREWLLSSVGNKHSHQWSTWGTKQELHDDDEDWQVIRVSGTMLGVVGLTCLGENHVNTTLEALMAVDNDSSANKALQKPQYKELDPPNPIFRQLDFDAIVDVFSLGTWAHVFNSNYSGPSLGPKGNMHTLGTETEADWAARRSGFMHSLALFLGMMRAYERKQTFVASDGTTTYIGIGPPSSELGDVLCILHGARTPSLLRKAKEEGEFMLVGACYVRGVMEGQLMEPEADDLGRSTQVLLIR